MTRTGGGTVDSPGTLVQKRANENRALLEVSPRTIRTMLEYKSAWYRSKLIAIAAETSQRCSACQAADAASSISRFRFVCTNCGSIFDVGVNAAKNILKPGISPAGGPSGMALKMTVRENFCETWNRHPERSPP